MSTENHEFTPVLLPPPSENESLDRRLVRGDHHFLGKKLFPYSFGVEGLLKEAYIGIQGDDLFILTFFHVLTQLQVEYDRHRAPGWDASKTAQPLGEDDATDAATAILLRQIHGDKEAFYARALRLRNKVGRKDMGAAIALQQQIVKEADQSEPMAAEPNGEPGK